MLIRLIALAVLCLSASMAYEVQAQTALSADDIVQGLKPKPRTRGIGGAGGLSADQSQFVGSLKSRTRGISIEEREQLSTIVTAAALPAIDFEVRFALNSTRLEQPAIETLIKLGMALKSPDLETATFLISGHTDARGARESNQKLSEERAAAVRAFLVSNFAIPADRLIAVGYGQEKLKNATDAYADENRRVGVVNLGKT